MIKEEDIRYMYNEVMQGGRFTDSKKKIISKWCKELKLPVPNEKKQCRNCWLDALVQVWREVKRFNKCKYKNTVPTLDELKNYKYRHRYVSVVEGVVISQDSSIAVKLWLANHKPNMFSKLFRKK